MNLILWLVTMLQRYQIEENFEPKVKKLLRDSYSHFLISRHQTAVEVFKVLSVVMTSSPKVVRTKKIRSIMMF